MDTKFSDTPPSHNLYTINANYVKNKVIVLDMNKNRMLSIDRQKNMVMAVKGLTSLTQKQNLKPNKGTLYKTTTVRNKFSSSNFALDKIMRKQMENNGIQQFSTEKDKSDENLLNATKSESDFSPDKELKETYYNYKFKNKNKESKYRQSKFSVNSSTSNYSVSTIYKVLNKKKNEFIDTIKKQSNNPDRPQDLLTEKRNFLKSNAITHYMEKKGDEVPYVFPIAWIHQNDYNNFSEKNRYEKITQLFMKLKYFIQRNEENEKEYLKEFMMKHGIYNQEYYSLDRLNNFMNFLNSKLKINPANTVKQIIIDATNYKGEDLEENNMRRTYISHKARKIMQYSMDNIRKSPFKNRKKQDEDRYSMMNYSAKNQPILQSKAFALNLNDPQSIIEGLEEEFIRLKNGFSGNKYKNLNDSDSSHGDKTQHPKSPLSKQVSYSNFGESPPTENKFLNIPKENVNHTVAGKSVKLAKVSADFDLDTIKKKNKLLEYIVLQRSKSKFQLQQDMKRFKISDINY